MRNDNKTIYKGIARVLAAMILMFFFAAEVKSQTCTASFIYSVGANGNVTFTSTSVGTNSGTPYTWNFGNNTSTFVIGNAGIQVNKTYTANGTYTVTLFVGSTITPCNSTVSQTISVTTSTNTTPCNLNLGTMSIVGTNTANTIGVIHNTTGTLSSTTYTYNWGDGNTSVVTAPFPIHSYTNAGTYPVTLIASNNTSPACTYSSSGGSINMCGGATFDVTINYSLGVNGQVSLFSSGVGTTSGTSYTWNVNPLGISGNYQFFTANPTFTLPNGVYTYMVFAANPGCLTAAGTNTITFTVTTAPPCTLTPAFTYSLLSNSTTQFYNQTTVSIGNMSGTTYNWAFGDGTNATISGNTINHAYSTNGTYSVILTVTTQVCGTGSVMVPVAVTNTGPNPCAPVVGISFNYVQSSGAINFNSTSTNVSTVSPVYSWQFGDGNTSALVNPSHTYSVNGVYNVTLQIANNASLACMASTVAAVTVTNACGGLAANISYSANVGTVNFTNSLVNSIPSATYLYQWDVGNNYNYNSNYTNTPNFVVQFINGSYNIGLTVTNATNASCFTHTTAVVTVTNSNPCALSATFTYTLGGSGFAAFTGLTSGTNSFTVIRWDFGDGSTANHANPIHTYTASGSYVVKFFVEDPFYYNSLNYCKDSMVSVINVSVTPCPSYTANYTHTITSNGLVNFTDASIGTNSATTYHWDFGDGWYSNAMSPNHTYMNGGVHYVRHSIHNFGCIGDSVVYTLNITGIPCLANANFSMVSSGTPQYWYAIPAYPYNITGAQWTWGDGSTSNTLYTSHQYSAAANYSICLTVTASCGSTATACYTYNIYRGTEGSSNIIFVDVLPGQPLLETGISEQLQVEGTPMVFPNPNNGHFTVKAPDADTGKVDLMDISGRVLQSNDASNGIGEFDMNAGELQNGIYFIRICASQKTHVQKVVIQR
jgi:PKD repeat protein